MHLFPGKPPDYRNLAFPLTVGSKNKPHRILFTNLFSFNISVMKLKKQLGTFQVMGNTIEVNLPYQKEKLRIELFGDTIEQIAVGEQT